MEDKQIHKKGKISTESVSFPWKQYSLTARKKAPLLQPQQLEDNHQKVNKTTSFHHLVVLEDKRELSHLCGINEIEKEGNPHPGCDSEPHRRIREGKSNI